MRTIRQLDDSFIMPIVSERSVNFIVTKKKRSAVDPLLCASKKKQDFPRCYSRLHILQHFIIYSSLKKISLLGSKQIVHVSCPLCCGTKELCGTMVRLKLGSIRIFSVQAYCNP